MTNTTTDTATFIYDAEGFWRLDSGDLRARDMQDARRAFPDSELVFKPLNGDTLTVVDTTLMTEAGCAERWRLRRITPDGSRRYEYMTFRRRTF